MTKKKAASHKSVTSPFEVSFAIAFLKDIHANYNNLYLLLAVIAWMRATAGHKAGVAKAYAAGFNPFGIKLKGGKLAKYSSIAAGAKAFVTFLQKGGFGELFAAPKTFYAKDTADQQRQAQDFLEAVVLSEWDTAHYGEFNAAASGYVDALTGLIDPMSKTYGKYGDNALVVMWKALLGHDVIIPTAQPPKQPQKGVPFPPTVRDNLAHWQYPDYLQPYTAEHFLEARDKPVAPLSVGVRGTV